MDRTQKAALLSAGIGLVVTGLKFYAAWLTGSLALYSDALESIINVVAAIGAFVALRVAARPADAEHPYGHHKAEFFSAVIEGALIVVAAVLILREAYFGLLAPKPLDAPAVGLAINLGAGAINAAWAWALARSCCACWRALWAVFNEVWACFRPAWASWRSSRNRPASRRAVSRSRCAAARSSCTALTSSRSAVIWGRS